MPASHPDTLARLETIANRRRLAATTPKERCIRALALMAIRLHRKELEASSGEGAKSNDERGMMNDESKKKSPGSSFLVHHSSLDLPPSPVGAFEAPAPPASRLFPDSRLAPDRAGSPSLDPVPFPSEIPELQLAPKTVTPARREGQRV